MSGVPFTQLNPNSDIQSTPVPISLWIIWFYVTIDLNLNSCSMAAVTLYLFKVSSKMLEPAGGAVVEDLTVL